MPEFDLTGEDWENKHIPDVLGGLIRNRNSEAMAGNQFLSMDGLVYDKNVMLKDTGYGDFGDIPSGAPGIFRRVFKHETASGTKNTFAISNLSFYVLANSGANWHGVQLNGGGDTTLTAAASFGNIFIDVVATTNFADGDRIAIRLDDGSDHITTVNGAPTATRITFDDPLPGISGVQASIGNACIEVIDLSGDSTKHVFALTIPWNDWLVFTNGIDFPQYYDPTTAEVQVVPNLPSSGDTICESLALFDTSLLLIRTTEGGSNFNQRIRWSDKADATEWVAGDAGFIDLLDSSDNIHNAIRLGPYLAIYRAKTIYRGAISTSASKRFQWDEMVSKHGSLSSASIADIGDKHFVVGNKQIYLYSGGFQIEPVGDPIKDFLYDPKTKDLDLEYAYRTFCVFSEARNDVIVFYQTPSATEWPNKCLRWFGNLNTWATRQFEDEMLGFGEATVSNSFTWDDLVGSWEDQTWTWDSASISGDLETLLFCTQKNQVVEYDYLTSKDDGVSQTYVLETPDFSHPNGVIRTDYIEFKISGTDILVEVSLNEGENWASIKTISPGAKATKVRVFKQVASRTIRYRLSGSDGFSLNWFNLRATLETEN